MRVRVHEHEGKTEPRCPYCHDDLVAGKTWECPACHTAHHVACARENKRCAELGCKGEFAEPAVTATHAPAKRRALGTGATLALAVATGLALLGLGGLGARATQHWDELGAGTLVGLAVLVLVPFVVLGLWLNDKLERRWRG